MESTYKAKTKKQRLYRKRKRVREAAEKRFWRTLTVANQGDTLVRILGINVFVAYSIVPILSPYRDALNKSRLEVNSGKDNTGTTFPIGFNASYDCLA